MQLNRDFNQYSICFPQNYAKDIAVELGKVMEIEVNIDTISNAMKNNGLPSEKTVCMFRHQENPINFIVMDCCNDDWLYSVCVRCSINKESEVKKVFSSWVGKLRLEFGEAVPESIVDTGDANSLFDSMIKRYKLTI